MRTPQQVREELINRFSHQKRAQVINYNSFGFIKTTDTAVYVTREKGKDTRIGYDDIETAVSAVRKDATVYKNGPGTLRDYGITHVTSPVWAIIHLMTLEELRS